MLILNFFAKKICFISLNTFKKIKLSKEKEVNTIQGENHTSLGFLVKLTCDLSGKNVKKHFAVYKTQHLSQIRSLQIFSVLILQKINKKWKEAKATKNQNKLRKSTTCFQQIIQVTHKVFVHFILTSRYSNIQILISFSHILNST